jgi:type IV pilus assembly protein PilB
MKMAVKKKLGDMLIENGLITAEQLKKALVEQKKEGVRLGKYLARTGILTENQIIETLCVQLKIKRYDSKVYPLDLGLGVLIPFDVAEGNSVVPIFKKGRLLTIAMVDPLDIGTMDFIESLTKSEVNPVVCTELELNSLIRNLYAREAMLGKVMEKMDTTTEMETSAEEADINVNSLRGLADDPPVMRLVNSVLFSAITEKASDVHISPKKDFIQLRFRMDGKLQDIPAPPKHMFLSIVARIKIMAGMDITLMRVPQDGRFSIKMSGREINVRVSCVPTIYGENVVMRLLDTGTGIYSLDRLGVSEKDKAKIIKAINKPHGMILSTGPTGSGKSTSLYSILGEINKPDIHILTLEDPVEYRVDNIRQVQLNTKAGMTFASGLRSLLRQDPDVIMVGEIRDAETARIAVQAAQTGHRLLSTLHTNDAPSAVTRLVDMGIEPFLIGSTLLMSFAQRLVRTICRDCRESYEPPAGLLESWGVEKIEGIPLYRGRGCSQCFQTGYKGRTGVFEVLVVDEMIHDMILNRVSAKDISREAVAAGKLTTLKQDALRKALLGITTLEEAESIVLI